MCALDGIHFCLICGDAGLPAASRVFAAMAEQLPLGQDVLHWLLIVAGVKRRENAR
jgi:hypothetical protein